MKGWQKNLLLIFPYIIVVGGHQYLGGAIAGFIILKSNIEENSFQQLLISTFDLIGTFMLLYLFMKFADKQSFSKLGFDTKSRASDFILGIALGFVIMCGSTLLLVAYKEIIFTKMVLNGAELAISFVLFSIVAVVEETLFRGYLLKNFLESFNKYLALIISSALFSLLHILNPNISLFSVISIFLAGIFLGISYMYTKNLWFPIGLHFSWNFFQSLFGFNVSGQDFYSLFEFKILEKNSWNGGNFGFEGSYISIFAMMTVIGGIQYYYQKKLTKI